MNACVCSFAAQYIDQVKPLEIFILQRFQFFKEDNGMTCAVTINQCKRTVLFGLQGCLYDRDHRRDTAACGKCQIFFCLGRMKFCVESSGWWQYFNKIAGL